jgi:hypothetical protein
MFSPNWVFAWRLPGSPAQSVVIDFQLCFLVLCLVVAHWVDRAILDAKAYSADSASRGAQEPYCAHVLRMPEQRCQETQREVQGFVEMAGVQSFFHWLNLK